MSIETRIAWLKAGSFITIGFGVVIVMAAIPALQAPTRMMLDFVFFPVDGLQDMSTGPVRLLSAITGGILVGWGIMLRMVATQLLANNPGLARRLILVSIFTWFSIDSSMSIAAGAPLNVVGNLGFLAVFVLPVWGLKTDS